jgi:ATP-dependent Zn protease
VQALLAECQQAVSCLLEKEQAALESLVSKFLEKEALTGEDVIDGKDNDMLN